MTTLQEWKAWTDPTKAGDVLRLLRVVRLGPGTNRITWQTPSFVHPTNDSVWYALQRSTNLAVSSGFSVVGGGLHLNAATNHSYTDVTAPAEGPCFDRIEVAVP